MQLGTIRRCAIFLVSAFQSSAEFAILVFQMFSNGHITWKFICKCVITVRRSEFPVPRCRERARVGCCMRLMAVADIPKRATDFPNAEWVYVILV